MSKNRLNCLKYGEINDCACHLYNLLCASTMGAGFLCLFIIALCFYPQVEPVKEGRVPDVHRAPLCLSCRPSRSIRMPSRKGQDCERCPGIPRPRLTLGTALRPGESLDVPDEEDTGRGRSRVDFPLPAGIAEMQSSRGSIRVSWVYLWCRHTKAKKY